MLGLIGGFTKSKTLYPLFGSPSSQFMYLFLFNSAAKDLRPSSQI
jgi:hypothetical protein